MDKILGLHTLLVKKKKSPIDSKLRYHRLEIEYSQEKRKEIYIGYIYKKIKNKNKNIKK